jgi:hypothetical protein
VDKASSELLPIWDVGQQKMSAFHNPWQHEDCESPPTAINVRGFEMRVLRVITPEEPLVDLDGMILFWEISYPTVNSAVITGIFHRRLILTTARRVEAARLDDGRSLRLKRLAGVEGQVPLHRVELALRTWYDGSLTIQFAADRKSALERS